MPEKEEWVMWKHDDHAIYDAFPDGEKIDAASIGLDFTEAVQVLASKSAMCYRQLKSKSKSWVITHYVAIRFEHEAPDGSKSLYCTTFSRDVDQWMYRWEEYQEV